MSNASLIGVMQVIGLTNCSPQRKDSKALPFLTLLFFWAVILTVIGNILVVILDARFSSS
jgi:hypothetical protein